MKKLFVCGGHVTPAIALIDELKGDKDIAIVYVGRKAAVEYSLVREKNIQFLPIAAGKRSWSTFTNIPVGFIQALSYCIREKPALIVSFGGYVALPVAIAAWLLRIPVITHEQTLSLGLANRIIAGIAKRVCLTFPETVKQFPSGVVTGLPIRRELFTPQKRAPYDIDEKHYPLIYITGGSQGARSLNEKIAPAIKELTKSFTVIHQTGPTTPKPAARYFVEASISVGKLSWILEHAMIVIGRSGANTTLECAALGKIAIFVPLPWAAGNEQLLLAKWLEARGSAVVIEQDRLNEKTLLAHVHTIRAAFDDMHKKALMVARDIPRDGAAGLAREVRSLL